MVQARRRIGRPYFRASQEVGMLLHSFVPATRANGPGLRSVVFFQGCSLHCPGCWNPSSQKFRGIDVTVLLESLIGTECQFMLLRCVSRGVAPLRRGPEITTNSARQPCTAGRGPAGFRFKTVDRG